MGINVYINYLVHMTKMAAMPIYGKSPSKIFFSESDGPISKNLNMKHQWLKYYNVYIYFFFSKKLDMKHQWLKYYNVYIN